MNRKLTAAVLMTLLIAPAAFAAVSTELSEFGKGPAKFLMTKQEEKQWKAISSDEEARKFITLFWARRDPTPGTLQNEFKAEFDSRVKFADDNFTAARTKGSLSDRGRVFIVIGQPTSIARTGAGGGGLNIQQGATQTMPEGAGGIGAVTQKDPNAGMPKQMWKYEKRDMPAWVSLKGGQFFANFTDQYATGEFKLVPGGEVNPFTLLTMAPEKSIVNPNVTLDDVAKLVAANTAPPPPPAPAAPVTALTTESYRTAVSAFKAGSGAAKPASVTVGEFITPEGTYFVPVQLYLTKDSGVTAGSKATFFGVIEDATGAPVLAFEEPVSITATKNDFFIDKSLDLKAGKYKGVFGVAVDGTPVAMGKADLNLTALDPKAATASRLIISNDVNPLTEAQFSTDPFAFGGIKVVPKGNRLFTKADELWYFVELRNPGVDATTSKPKVQVGLEIEGMVNKQKKTMRAPLAEVDVQELKGVPGHYAIGSAIPLTGFAPGEYTMKVKVIDTVSKLTYNLQDSFKVVAE